MIHEYTYASHPFDVVGWDGYNFPYAFSIHDFESITGHQSCSLINIKRKSIIISSKIIL